MASKKFTDMRVWQNGHALALLVYKVTKRFPKDEQFALTNQLRRAATSVPSNIAEGFNRLSQKEKVQFYSIALGSAGEVQSQSMLGRDLEYMNIENYLLIEDLSEIVHMELVALIKSIRSSDS